LRVLVAADQHYYPAMRRSKHLSSSTVFSAFDGFVNSGWEFGGQASAAAKTSPEKGGSMAGAASVSDGVWMYQLTDKGLVLKLTGKERNTPKIKDLNKS
jgi:hypothetical protein